jgi:hypothetical protein
MQLRRGKRAAAQNLLIDEPLVVVFVKLGFESRDTARSRKWSTPTRRQSSAGSRKLFAPSGKAPMGATDQKPFSKRFVLPLWGQCRPTEMLS